MPGQLRLGASEWYDLDMVSHIEPRPITELAARLEALDPPPLTRAELERIFRSALPEREMASALLSLTFGISNLLDRLEVPPEVIFDDIRSYPPSNWDESDLPRWSTVETAFKRLVSSPVIRRVVRSEGLVYDHANVLQSARIITDLRPVFTDDRGDIEGAIVSFILRIGYLNGEVVQSISFAMDRQEVERLEQQCRRSLVGAETIERRFSQPGEGTSIRVVGEIES